MALPPELPATRRLRAIVVSAVRLHGDALMRALENVPALDVVGYASIERAAATVAALEEAPEVILIDASLETYASFIDAIRAAAPSARLIAVGVDEETEILACARAGMSGYIHRHASLEELPAVVMSVIKDELVCSPRAAAQLFRGLQHERTPAASESPLTFRELEVLALIQHGQSNKEIAGELRISVATVKNHVHNLLEKLQVKGRLQAARMHTASPQQRSLVRRA